MTDAWRLPLLSCLLLGVIGGGAGLASEAGGVGRAKEVRFLVYGGTDGTGDAHAALVAQMVKLRPELVAHAGGLVGTDQSAAAWRAFKTAVEPLLAVTSFYGCRGMGESSAYCEPRPGFPQVPRGGVCYYSFDYRSVHLVFLDTERRVEKRDPQTAWLDRDLGEAAGKPIFVFCHRAIFGAAERNVLTNGELAWHPVFARHKVRAVFSGARHLYHHTSEGGVTYVITGGGGGYLNPVMARRQVLPADVAGAFYHFIEVTVAPEEIRCRAIDIEGKTRDEFLIPPVSDAGK